MQNREQRVTSGEDERRMREKEKSGRETDIETLSQKKERRMKPLE